VDRFPFGLSSGLVSYVYSAGFGWDGVSVPPLSISDEPEY